MCALKFIVSTSSVDTNKPTPTPPEGTPLYISYIYMPLVCKNYVHSLQRWVHTYDHEVTRYPLNYIGYTYIHMYILKLNYWEAWLF